MIYALIAIVLIGIFLISTYNKLVGQREFVRNAMSNIAAQIESRWDALSNLIEATKRYSDQEAKVLTDITAKRAGVTSTSSASDVQTDDNLFRQAVSKINVVAENYPDLKASQVYMKTMDSVNLYEDKVRTSRMLYNDSVTKLNRQILQFPTSLIAGMLGFKQEEYFKNTEGKSDMPSW